MKRLTIYSTLILFIIAGCGGKRQTDNNDLITVDVTNSYSQKKELILQDFMDVEYIALETKDDFYNKGLVEAIGEKYILVTNRNRDGNIYVYDRTGKAIRKINRKGEGAKEYISINCGITLDENNNEIFANDFFKRRILVYDLYGNFKRSFKDKEGDGSLFYTDIFNYNKDSLICYNAHNEKTTFLLVSKQDGSAKEIKIPFKEKKLLEQRLKDAAAGTETVVYPDVYRSITPFKGSWILLELSSDTVYTFLPDYSLRPFMVRTPSIQSMDPEVFLILRLLSDRYIFMETIKNVYDFGTESGFPKTYFMYDTHEKAFSGYTVYNGDFSTKKEIYMSVTRPVNHEIESWYPLQSFQLVKSYEKGELKGKLKEIAATLDEESNPVIMLIKHKK